MFWVGDEISHVLLDLHLCMIDVKYLIPNWEVVLFLHILADIVHARRVIQGQRQMMSFAFDGHYCQLDHHSLLGIFESERMRCVVD